MRKIFSDIPEAVENVAELVAKIEKYKLDHPPVMPEFELPEGYTDKDGYLRHLTYRVQKRDGASLRQNRQKGLTLSWKQLQRWIPGYFLIVQDFLKAAREMGVSVGPGRGSAAGSAVAFA